MPIIVPTITCAAKRMCINCLSRKMVLNARFNRIQNCFHPDVGNVCLLGNVTTLSCESNSDVVHTSADTLFCDDKSSLFDRLMSVWSTLLFFEYVRSSFDVDVRIFGLSFDLLISLAMFFDIPCNWMPISFSVSNNVFAFLCEFTAITSVGTASPYSPLATSITANENTERNFQFDSDVLTLLN